MTDDNRTPPHEDPRRTLALLLSDLRACADALDDLYDLVETITYDGASATIISNAAGAVTLILIDAMHQAVIGTPSLADTVRLARRTWRTVSNREAS